MKARRNAEAQRAQRIAELFPCRPKHPVRSASATAEKKFQIYLEAQAGDKLVGELRRRLADALAALGERKLDDSMWLVTDSASTAARNCNRW
jgi:hypothetical protein